MTDPAHPLLNQAAELLGPRGLIRDPDLLAPWLTDWRGRYTGKALALAAPADAHELAALVRLCALYGVAMVPQGGNSGMSGGATPDSSGTALLISLRRMNAILPVDAPGRKVTCGAGAVLQDLHNAAEAAGLRFPLTLGGKGSATIGGLISTNAGGTQVLRHGSMRAQVLGIEAVLPDGRIYSALTPLKKDNRGFDLKQLFIGSEGTLGIVTAATLRLVPQTPGRVVAWAGCGSIHAARALLLLAEEHTGTIDCTGPEALTMGAFIASLRQQLGHSPATVLRLPQPLTTLSARLGDAVPQSPWCSETLAMLGSDNVGNPAVFEQLLGRKAVHYSQLVATAWR